MNLHTIKYDLYNRLTHRKYLREDRHLGWRYGLTQSAMR